MPPLRTVATLGTCTDAQPKIVAVSDGQNSTDCVTGGGAFDVLCTCKDGLWSVTGSTKSAAGEAISVTASAPTQTASAQAGVAATLTASNAVAGSSNAGAAAGGSVTITAGNAARFTSGNANGGNVIISSGAGTGGGIAGNIYLRPSGVPDQGLVIVDSGYQQIQVSAINYPGTNKVLSLTGGAYGLDSYVRVGSQSGSWYWAAPDSTPYVVEQRYKTNAQTYRLYGTYTDASNYERLSLSTTAGSSVTLAAETAGTGADNLDILLKPAGTGTVQAYGQGSYPEDQVQIGPGAIATSTTDNNGSVAIGQSATTAASRGGVAVGSLAQATGTSLSIAVGRDAQSAGSNAMAVGGSSRSSVAEAVAIGYDAQVTSGYNGVALGSATRVAGATPIAIGSAANASFDRSIAIGQGTSTTAANQLVIGSDNGASEITSAYVGSGVVDDAPKSFTLNATGGSGTNVAGANLTLAGGKGTGSGTPGSVIIQTSTAGSTGTTLQTLATRATFGSTSATISVPLLSQVLVSPKATTPVTVASTDSGTLYTNEGATALTVFNLPTAAAGYCYDFAVQDADGIKVVANTGDTIRIATGVSASAGYVQNLTIGSTLRLCSINATEWFSMGTPSGTWTIDS